MTHFLVVENTQKEYLGGIRHWHNLKICFEENQIWVKDFTEEQIDSTEVKSIPYKNIYYANGNKLFLKGSLLPSRNLPSLLWSPIDRGLPVKLPSFNYNYFGVQEKINIQLIPADKEQEGYALMTDIELLGAYMTSAPAVRLQKLDWIIFKTSPVEADVNSELFTLPPAVANKDLAIIFGTPLLPVQGKVFWRKGNFLIPAGYDFDLHSLIEVLDKLINPQSSFIVVWNMDSTYFLLDKKEVQMLSISSFRLSTKV